MESRDIGHGPFTPRVSVPTLLAIAAGLANVSHQKVKEIPTLSPEDRSKLDALIEQSKAETLEKLEQSHSIRAQLHEEHLAKKAAAFAKRYPNGGVYNGFAPA